MGLFRRLFARKMRSALLDQALAGSRLDVVAAAEGKLGRSLTPSERQGLERIESLMMLESCYRAYSSSATAAEVIADLAHFAKAAEAHSIGKKHDT